MADHTIASIKQERARVLKEAQDLHVVAAEEKRSLTAEENEKFDRLIADTRSLGKQVDQMEVLRELGSEYDVTSTKTAGIASGDLADGTRDQVQKTDEYRSAFEKYLREGRDGMSQDEIRALRAGMGETRADMLTTQATHGGYVVPIDFAKQVISAKVNLVSMRRTRATVFNTSNGQALPVPVQSAYGAAAFLAEGSANTALQDTGAKVTLNAYTMVTSRNVSYQLLQDGNVDVASLVAGNIGNAFGLAEDTAFTVGAGTTTVQGHLTSGVTTGTTTGTGHLPNFTYAELLAFYFSVAPQYRRVGEFILQDASVAVLAGLTDSQARPIWTASMIPGEPDSLMGKPLYSTTSGVTPAANVLIATFGDFANGYGIRQAGGIEIKRSDERLIDSLETIFVAWERFDGQVLDNTAIKNLKLAAS